MKLEDAGSPRWATKCINCWPPFVSLALLALGGSDLTRWVLPSNPELW
jgi:hypothetical protein